MHAAARRYAEQQIRRLNLNMPGYRVAEFGGRNINGVVRYLFADVDEYVSVDINAGREVDIIANAATVVLPGDFDVVVSTELLEHTSEWREVIANAYAHLRTGGVFLATMAGPGREPHGAAGVMPLPTGEHYANIDPGELMECLVEVGFSEVDVDQLGDDVRCWAVR